MRLVRLGALAGLLSVVTIEVTRQVTLRMMEGEGSALWTYLVYSVLGFPLSVISSPILRRAHEALEMIPGPAAYLLMLAIAFANWAVIGFLADRWRDGERRRSADTTA